jgi:DNA mismatch endonuclease (patch repair protein)
MADVVSSKKRSQMMAGVKAKNTKPEILVRQALHARGFRFRLHRNDLPGKPDLFLPKYRTAIFVHGCFWHGHDCSYFKLPKTNSEFWREKIATNQRRDEIAQLRLRDLGILPLVVWECETRKRGDAFVNSMDQLQARILNIVN